MTVKNDVKTGRDILVVSDLPCQPQQPPNSVVSAELTGRISAFVEALVGREEEACEAEFVHLLDRVNQLVDRKFRLEGTKTDTRDFLGELVFTRMRRGMHQFLAGEDQSGAERAAEWVMGLLFSVSTLTEFAKAFDQSLIRSQDHSQDFNFAGRTDFISVEEVLQMLSAGKHLGCLSLEKGDNRLDIYLKEGRVYFLDPHHLVRRVVPGDGLQHQEISEAAITAAEARRAQEGVPVIISLADKGAFGTEDLSEVMRVFGKEVLFDFMSEQEPYGFYYRQLDKLPEFAVGHDLRLGVTAILLEGSKVVDDWKQMLTVFPDPDAPIEPKADMFARMGDVALGVMEIKLLSQINGDTTPRSLVATLGLPLSDVYKVLIRLSKEGILSSVGDAAALHGIDLGGNLGTMQESMQEAFAALDANDDEGERKNAIDRVFGEDDEESGDGGLSALDRVLGSGSADQDKSKSEIDLSSILKKK